MIQNILKYRTVIIALLNTHPHVLKIYILIFFSLVGGLVCLGGKTVESVLSLSLSSDTGGLLSTLAFFFLTLSNSDRQAGIIILIQHRYVRL